MAWMPDPRGCPPVPVPPPGIIAAGTLERMAVHALADGLDLDDVLESKAYWDARWVSLQRHRPWRRKARARWRREMASATRACEDFGNLLIGWMRSSGVRPVRDPGTGRPDWLHSAGLPGGRVFSAGTTETVDR
jgi:hypothetical protein